MLLDSEENLLYIFFLQYEIHQYDFEGEGLSREDAVDLRSRCTVSKVIEVRRRDTRSDCFKYHGELNLSKRYNIDSFDFDDELWNDFFSDGERKISEK